MFPLSLLFKRFLKIGATAYGGPAIAGQMKKAVVNEWGWIKEPEFMQGLALCQMTPGATFVMLSTYIGYRLGGIWGAFTSAVAFVMPAFILLVVLSALYFQWGDLWFIRSLFKGLGAVVVGIVVNAFIGFSKNIVSDWKAILIAALSFFGFFFRWNVALVFLLAALAALLLRPKASKPASPPAPTPAPGAFAAKTNYLFLGILAGLVAALFAISYFWNPRLSQLALTLAKVGALAFGGGFTIIPLIQYEVVDKFHWVSTKEFLDGIAMGQVTPGPIMITATFLGYKMAGFWGALLATIGIFSPPFFIINLLIPQYDRLKALGVIRRMEQGILAAFIGMLGLVLYTFGRTTFVDIPSVIFTLAAFAALLKKIDLVYILLTAAVLSVLFFGFLM
ncbi:MAG: chromate efflux transporter [Deltaproteobacteria bacterium]|nr:chromate efflux transporter [Deltaproteobacteria bacterium]